jgi:ABC-type transporter Mla subunit MlaD
MASLKDVEGVADDLSGLVDELRQELRGSPSFEKLVQLADAISEHADEAAETFSTINDVLTARIDELKGGAARNFSEKSSGSSRAKARS